MNQEMDNTHLKDGLSPSGGGSHSPRGSTTLLERLLGLLRTGGVHSLGSVAEELETTPALVEVMLEDLSQRGYLRTVEGPCTERCQACPMTGECAIAGAGRVWSFTDKGPVSPGT